jgi:Tfp pilus assembly protein PilF
MKPEPATKASFITFYSFKGGVGRSMALINTAGILAERRGFSVLVLDLDLEAPGLSYLDPEAPDAASAQAQPEFPFQPGFVDLLTDAKERGQEADLFALSAADIEAKYTRKIKIPDDLREFSDGALRIMPAGRFDHNYARRLDALNLNALYRNGVGEPLIRAFKKKLAESGRYHYVLVDSRTGISEGAGVCTRDLADHVMILSGLNRQNVEGTSEFLREFRSATDGKKTFQIILSPMPNGEDKLPDDRRTVAEKAFQQAWGRKLDVGLEIPYHPQLALTEEPHIFRRRRGYLFEAYLTIEASMLDALGHNAQTYHRRITESLAGKQYEPALRDLNHLIRLDRGQGWLTRLTYELMHATRRRRGSEREPNQEPVEWKYLVNDERGRAVAEFIVDKLSFAEGDGPNRRLLHELKERVPQLAERLAKRLLETFRNNANFLGDYAVAFEEEQMPDLAEEFYKRAVDSDPKHARNLWNYGDFLEQWRSDLDAAESYYKQAIEANPKDAKRLSRYAVFLNRRRMDLDAAESYHKRAVEADPQNPEGLFKYAVFVQCERGDLVAAESLYKRVLAVDPENSTTLCNYGQVLACQGHLQEAEENLLAAFNRFVHDEREDAAEVCFSLWLVARMQGHDAERWERCFKHFIQEGFERYVWSFDRMLKKAEMVLLAEDFEYAKALAAAFLDKSKVADLSQYPRWQVLEPLDPKPLQPVASS